MRILLTNDDGVHAAGLLALKQALEPIAEVEVIAPDRPRSACGHSVTLHKPLHISTVLLADGSTARACSGTPSDCVMLALRGLLDETPDLVFSGINNGPNLGWDLTYSGTVSAAMEACTNGVPAVAVSAVRMDVRPYTDQDHPGRGSVDYRVGAAFAAHLAGILAVHRLPEFTFLNVNVPSLPAKQVNGVRLTRQGVRRYTGQTEEHRDAAGSPYYLMAGDYPEDRLEEGTDVKALHDRAISVTPVHMDLTAYPVMDALHQWTHIEAFQGQRDA